MAKKKLTKAQRKARAHARYVRAEYYKNFDALSYMGNHPLIKDLTIPNKITMTQVKKIRKIYNIVRKELEAAGMVFATKVEMAKAIREEPTQQYRQYRAEPEEDTSYFNPDIDYLHAIRQEIESLTPRLVRTDSEKKRQYDQDRVDEAKQRLLGTLDYVTYKTDPTMIAEILAADKFVDRVFSINNFYAWEMVDEIDDNLIPLLQAAMDNVLDKISNE